jgi:hypothetical protein
MNVVPPPACDCYACTFWDAVDDGRVLPSWKDYSRASLYEDLVHLVERTIGQGKEMSISEVWRQQRFRGPTDYNMLRKVMHDMARHGLIVCVHVDRAGKCRRYGRIET